VSGAQHVDNFEVGAEEAFFSQSKKQTKQDGLSAKRWVLSYVVYLLCVGVKAERAVG